MEQNKLETQFKEKLNSREIKPTEMAWDRLDAMLSVAENIKPKRKFNWLYIAASFVGFLLFATIFLNRKENTIDIQKNTLVIEKTSPKENSKTEIKSIITAPNFSKTILISETRPLVQTQKNTKEKVENPIVNTQENVEAEIQSSNRTISIAEHKNSIPENIDSLLASVEKNKKTSVENSSLKINSTDLLTQVDDELALSFREKALNTINKKFKEAKEALVNRNNQ